MSTQELGGRAASVRPENVFQVVLATWRKRRHRELCPVHLYRVMKALGASANERLS